MYKINGNPLETFVYDGGYTSIFRTLGCIGDSLSSGEHESLKDGVKGYHDYYEYSWGQFIARKCGLTAFIDKQTGADCSKNLINNITKILLEFLNSKPNATQIVTGAMSAIYTYALSTGIKLL